MENEQKIIKRFTDSERPYPCLFFKLGNTFYRLDPTWRSVGCDAARLRLHTERGSSIPHAHETVVSHLITEAQCNCNFTRSLQTAWGIWRRTIANCKISGSKIRLVRKRTCLAIACGPSENVDGVKISTWIHVWRTERGKGFGIVTSLAVTRRKLWVEDGLVPTARQTESGWKHGFCVFSGGRDRYRVHNRPDLEEGLSCGHTARARGG
ncbi:hypothetical protein CCUS01_06937 [Colletotrichum cuscutae]|uniref:Uncharacterized protein n=1 Tax=Colletotrichum cuscutae TaxID=1209917 RepID=A0AAI9XXT6_9PEZI|nr:hypothetical protein CCUS01_06937 [Colletotrichum cuscutae]